MEQNISQKKQSGSKNKKKKARQKKIDYESLNIIRYESFETLKICPQNREFYIETDNTFIKDVEDIAKIRKNAVLSFFEKKGRNQLTDEECDEIDHKARLHYKANVINSNSNIDFNNAPSKKRCECGCRRCSGQLLDLCTDEQKLNILGPGILLMFLYKRSIIAVLGMILIIYGIFALVTNLIGNEASINDTCASDPYCEYRHKSSNENKNYADLSLVYAQLWLGLAFSFVWVVTLRFIKFMGREKNQIVDRHLRSASDFTIKIQNLPYGSYSEMELIQYFQGLNDKMSNKNENEQMDNNPFKMKSIQIIYNMQFSRQMIQQIFYLCYIVDSCLVKGEGQAERNYVRDVKSYQQNKNKLKQTYELLIDLRKKFLNDPSFRQSISTTCCLIEFKSQYMRHQLLENFGIEKVSLLKQLQEKFKDIFRGGERGIIFKGNFIEIERAPEPSDLLWENCEKTYSLKRKLIIYSVTFIIVLVSFAIQMGLEYLQNLIKSNPDAFLSDTESQAETLTTINIAMSVGILLVNRFLWFSLYYLLEIEYNHTLTEKIISQMNKVLLAASVNTIVVPIITRQIFIIISPEDQNVAYETLYAVDGLSGMVFDYQISVLAGLIIKLFDPLFFIKRFIIEIKCLRNLYIRFTCGKIPDVNPDKGVIEINKFYEGSYMDVAQTYMYIIGAVLHASFFCHLQPFVILLVFCMVIVFYLINRFKLLRFCLIPEITELLVFETALTHAGLVPIIYGVGSLVISYFQSTVNPKRPVDYSYIPSSLCIFIGVLAFFNPGDFLNKIVKKIMEKCECISLQNLIGQRQSTQDIEIRDQFGEQNKETTNRVEVYYENSNSLSLLGFEKILRGEQEKGIMDELQVFCESFFPKKNRAQKQDQKICIGKGILDRNESENVRKSLKEVKVPQHLKKKTKMIDQEGDQKVFEQQNSGHKLVMNKQREEQVLDINPSLFDP